LAVGYELGHIVGKFYSRSNFPNDAIFLSDLWNLINIYKLLKENIGTDIFNINPIISESPESNEPSIMDQIAINKLTQGSKTKEEIQAILDSIEEKLQGVEPKKQRKIIKAIERNSKIANLIKENAGFKCEVCGCSGFEKVNGELYAEAHHKDGLCKSGRDIPSNMICVCPTCHAIIHYGNEKEFEIRRRLNNKK
jgi:5-methylcytosine-specific restriction protein A